MKYLFKKWSRGFKTLIIGWIVAGAMAAVAAGLSGAELITMLQEEANEPDEIYTFGEIPADGVYPSLAPTE